MNGWFSGAAAFLAICSAHAGTLDKVKARQLITCGIVAEAPDWTKDDTHGDLSALEAAFCHAVAAAILGRPDAIALKTLPAENEALRALQAQKLDLAVGVTPSATRSISYQLAFGPAIFWDSQGFLMHAPHGDARLESLAGKTVCYIDGTEPGEILLAAMAHRKIGMLPYPFQEEGEMEAALTGGHCTAISASLTKLAGIRAVYRGSARDLVLLPDRLGVTPVSMATRQDDPAWSTIVATIRDVLVLAEMQGVTAGNVASMRASTDPLIRHLLGTDWSAAESLGLAHDFGAHLVESMGNYGEIFDRTIGAGSELHLTRGLNAVCTAGGAICAAPVR